MKKLLFCLFIITIFSCNSRPNFESRIKQFMKDSVVTKFNDPASYQYVSMQLDTFKGADYIHNIRTLYIDTSLVGADRVKEEQRQADSLENIINYKDSVFYIGVKVKCRAKNKMGALILDDVKLKYFPSTDRILQ